MNKNNEEFEEQLKQEALAKEQKEASETRIRKDDDGTEYDWDEEKQAWFPKIDDDFIAKYQMNYGTTATETTTESTEQATTASTDPEPRQYTEEETKKYWDDYYKYYYSYYTNTDGGATQGEITIDDEEKYKQYLEYCQYYYSANYTEEQDKTEESTGETRAKTDTGESESAKKTGKTKGPVKRKPAEPPKWFDVDGGKNTNVYVSGLPLDTTDQEFSELMCKCGLVMHDPRTRKPKLKLYRDENGQPKGDARCCYIKRESVDLAMQIIDGSDMRGHTLHVEIAKFEMKGEFDPSKCKKKLTNKEKRKAKEKQEKLFDWHPDKLKDMRPSHEKVIVLKNMFDPSDFEKNPVLITDLRNDIRDECVQFGDVKKVVVFDRHEDGVVMVFYREAAPADLCKQGLNGRWFAKRRIIAATWDGITKYDVEETPEEKQKRLSEWDSFLEGESGKKPDKAENTGEDGGKTAIEIIRKSPEKTDTKLQDDDTKNFTVESSVESSKVGVSKTVNERKKSDDLQMNIEDGEQKNEEKLSSGSKKQQIVTGTGDET